ncbi:VOC family protein [Hymenobacter sp. RP-2-7]|uniref:VOC family protein n=1 Tax=Hymenobacter polaris TaxID=2682546 RepID=A0A7Y0AB10_9BACT|nr:VOC family protein [Hymenobacter polaris]NML64027.1 VOC family protein [Hymenobacter polaris]
MNLKINRLQHIGLPVTHLETSRAFYQRLGFEVVMEATFPHEGGLGQVLMLRRGDLTLELYQLPEPELSRVKQRGDGRIDHIAFDVDDIDEAYATLQAAGFTMLEPQPSFLNFWDRGCRFFNIAGPDGERLEFCQIL